uniref:Tax1-binding protein 1 homolog B-like n=1 Tax=Phallusia mammillata TaxID=59560 RepID=A0A6F9DUY4_9ASCI|nr:tax1-binding protein 1 homolog B-like [Phallusia mammillata]
MNQIQTHFITILYSWPEIKKCWSFFKQIIYNSYLLLSKQSKVPRVRHQSNTFCLVFQVDLADIVCFSDYFTFKLGNCFCLTMADTNVTSQVEMINSSDAPFIPESFGAHEMAISNFSQVIFPDVPDFYPPEKDVKVTYIVTETIEPSSRDWVGLFRVGWASPRDYSTYIWAPKPLQEDSTGNKSQTVTFQAYQLPGDDNEFYQFCYVTKQGYVRGASTPFQFRMSTENDNLVEVEDENGLIILKTKSDALQEQLNKVNLEKDKLHETIGGLESAKQELESEMDKVITDMLTTEDKLKNEQAINMELEKQLEKLTAEHEKITKRLSKADKRIEKTKSMLAETEETVEKLQDEIECLREDIRAAEDEKEELVQKHLEQIQQRDSEVQRNEVIRLEMLDQIRTLSLQHDELRQSAKKDDKKSKQQVEDLEKKNEELVAKLRRYKDERDLFKTQFTETEISRQQGADLVEALRQQLQISKDNIQTTQQKLTQVNAKFAQKEKELESVNKKCRNESNAIRDAMRNSSEQVNALEASKRLLRQELVDVSTSRDQLMMDLHQLKKDKEALLAELKGAESTIHALESQLETVEDKLEEAEKSLCEYEQKLLNQRREAEEMECEMHGQIVLLRKQLEDSDTAVAQATRICDIRPSKTSRKTQTAKKKQANSEVQATTTKDQEEKDAKDQLVTDLKTQVEDLTTRLSMGADAYKDKFVECHKLEKKLKKFKQQQAKQSTKGQTESADKSTSAVGSPRDDEPENQGFMNSIGKLLMAIADPDAEEQEQATNLRSKLEEMEKSIQTEHARYIKYKQLYGDEKKKLAAQKTASDEREQELVNKLELEQANYKALNDENAMLQYQLNEFVQSSTDRTVLTAMSYPSSNDDELSSSPDPAVNYRRDPDITPTEDDSKFLDAPEYPMVYPHEDGPQLLTGSSDASDEFSDGRPTSSKSVTRSAPVPCSKGKVISRQPIGCSPTFETVSAAKSSSASGRKKKGGKNRKKTRKTVDPVM